MNADVRERMALAEDVRALQVMKSGLRIPARGRGACRGQFRTIRGTDARRVRPWHGHARS